MRIYVSGPMRSKPGLNLMAFHEMAQRVEAAGHVALNPARNPLGLTLEQYMDIDLAMLRAADAVIVLPDWDRSLGAGVEVAYARYLGKPVYQSLEEITCLTRAQPAEEEPDTIAPMGRPSVSAAKPLCFGQRASKDLDFLHNTCGVCCLRGACSKESETL